MGKISGIDMEYMKLDKNLKGLVLALEDEDELVRKEAAHALGDVGTPDCIPYLNDVINDDSAGVRAVATLSLGKIANKNDENSQKKILELVNDKEWSVRCAALQSLHRISGDKYLDKISAALVDEDPHVQDVAFNILEKLKKDYEKSDDF